MRIKMKKVKEGTYRERFWERKKVFAGEGEIEEYLDKRGRLRIRCDGRHEAQRVREELSKDLGDTY